MPSKSLVHCGEKHAKNFKQPKDRVTLLGCANASGTCRLPLGFIHKPARPRCFKHMDMGTLPVKYYSQKNAWMDTKIFEKWFHENFAQTMILNTKFYYCLITHLHTTQRKSWSQEMAR